MVNRDMKQKLVKGSALGLLSAVAACSTIIGTRGSRC